MSAVHNKTEPIEIFEHRKRKSTTTSIKSADHELFNSEYIKLSDLNNILEYNAIIMRSIDEQRSAKEGATMDWQERYIDKLDRDVSEMKASLKATEDRIAGMINQTLSEMRDRDNQRHTEVLALKTDIQVIRSDNAETRRWVIGMVIGAIGVALAAIIGIVSVVLILI